jgi:hypothetical protein
MYSAYLRIVAFFEALLDESHYLGGNKDVIHF